MSGYLPVNELADRLDQWRNVEYEELDPADYKLLKDAAARLREQDAKLWILTDLELKNADLQDRLRAVAQVLEDHRSAVEMVRRQISEAPVKAWVATECAALMALAEAIEGEQ